jgi:tetratricopeptide (TPR) repeat protein
LTALLICAQCSLSAKDLKVTLFSGKFFVRDTKSKEWRPGASGINLKKGYYVKTATASEVQLALGDTVIKISENAIIAVENLYDEKKKSYALKLSSIQNTFLKTVINGLRANTGFTAVHGGLSEDDQKEISPNAEGDPLTGARDLYASGDYKGTISTIRKLVPKLSNEERSEAFTLLGLSCYNEGNFEESLIQCKKTQTLPVSKERKATSLFLMGITYASLGKDGAAIQHFKTYSERYPDSIQTPDALYMLAIIYYKNSDKGMAKKYYREIIKRHTTSPAATDARNDLEKIL